MLAFGAYLHEDTSLLRVGAAVVFLDILFALAAGFMVVALLAPVGQAPVSGLKLVFEAVPAAATATATAGGWFSTLFFFMLLLVALTSAVGLMEPVVVWVMARFEASRVAAATAVGAVIWFLGLGTLLSFNLMADFTLLEGTVFDWLSLLSSRLLLPAVGLLLCLFAGRFLHPDRLRAAWSDDDGARAFAVWRWMLRYPARIGLILVLLYSVDVFSFLENLW
jgi:NSS family neurotransmitter:Na+ symporter